MVGDLQLHEVADAIIEAQMQANRVERVWKTPVKC